MVLVGQGVHLKGNHSPRGCLDKKDNRRSSTPSPLRSPPALPSGLPPSPSSFSPALIIPPEAGSSITALSPPKPGSCSDAGPELGGLEHNAVPLSLSCALWEMGTGPQQPSRLTSGSVPHRTSCPPGGWSQAEPPTGPTRTPPPKTRLRPRRGRSYLLSLAPARSLLRDVTAGLAC